MEELRSSPHQGNWGRWGEDDEAGALNLVGPTTSLRALGLATTGRVLSLAQPLGPATPVPHHRKAVERLMMRDGGDYAAGAGRPGGFQFAEEVLGLATHSGTHVDALAHAWYDDHLYNGHSARTVRSTSGATRCGAESLRPVVTRGVLIDVEDSLDPDRAGAPVTADVLERHVAGRSISIEPGDVALIRTGWLGRTLEDAGTYLASEPGLDVTGARWLAERDVAVVGADNFAVEALPFLDDDVFPVHQLLIRDFGVPLLEGVVLDELAATGVQEFAFVLCPLPIVGGTASPAAPIAIL